MSKIHRYSLILIPLFFIFSCSERNYPEALITSSNNTTNHFYKTGTNGITYHSILYPCKNLTSEEFKVASLFASTLTDVGIDNKGFEEVQRIQSAYTGGISANFSLVPDQEDFTLALQISSKSLEKNDKEMQDLMIQTVTKSNFTEKERIKDLLNFISSSNERSLIQNGHILAMSNAGAQINNVASTSDIVSGLNFINYTSDLTKNINKNENLERYIDILQSIKRARDRGASGWWILVPFYGLWLLFGDSVPGENKYGLRLYK